MFADTADSRATVQSAPVIPRICEISHGRIDRNILTPGDRTSEYGNGRCFGISPQPLRQAFANLAERSQITARPPMGAIFSTMMLFRVKDARLPREGLEADIGSHRRRSPTRRPLRQSSGRLHVRLAEGEGKLVSPGSSVPVAFLKAT